MTPTRRLGYRPALDGVRGIAILTVLAIHVFDWPPSGGIGVDLFFVLSGFLITTLLVGERQANGRVSLLAFYRRRVLRLVPALVAMLTVYAIVTVGALGHTRTLRPLIIGGVYLTNVFAAWWPSVIPPGLGHLWSLAEEEQFYLLWPPLLFLVFWRRPRSAMWFLWVVLVLLSIERVFVFLHTSSVARIHAGPDTHAYPIIVGCITGLAFSTGSLPWIAGGAKRRQFFGVAGLIAFFTSTVAIHELYALPLLVFVAFACAALVLAAATETTGICRVLSWRPLTYLGRISYSLYLWHQPILVAYGADAVTGPRIRFVDVATVATSLVLASASFKFIEQPFLRRKRREQIAPEEIATPDASEAHPALVTA